jgi:hypothetical protein
MNTFFFNKTYQKYYRPYLAAVPNLGTAGRINASINLGYMKPSPASSSRIALWERRNPPPKQNLGSTPYNNNTNGGYGGGGGAGAPQYKNNSPGNGYSGGNGGNGIVILYGQLGLTNNGGGISGNPASPLPPIPPPPPNTDAIFELTSSNGSIAYADSSYPGNTGYNTNSYYNNEANYYCIVLGPGTFTLETNLTNMYLIMTGGGGGGAGGPSLQSSNCIQAGGGGGGDAVVAGFLSLYETVTIPNNLYGCTTTINITVGSGGPGGASGLGSNWPNNACGGQGSNGSGSTVSFMNNQFSKPITFTTTGGKGGQPVGSAYANEPFWGIGGAGGTYTYSELSSVALYNFYLFYNGGTGGQGTTLNSINQGNSNTFQNELINPPTGVSWPPPDNLGFSAPIAATSNTLINLGGGGGGGNGEYYSSGSPGASVGGQGAGGNGGCVQNIGTQSSVNISWWDVIADGIAAVDGYNILSDICVFAFA